MVASAPPVRDTNQLLALAKEHDFEVLRDDARGRIVKKGTTRFVLPPSGDANHITSQAILSICNEMDLARRKPARLPLQVQWQGDDWAVRSQNSAQYELQSLKDGHRVWASKWEVQEVVTSPDGGMNTPQYTNGNTPTPTREPTPDPEVVARMAAREFPVKPAETEAPVQEPVTSEGPKLTVHPINEPLEDLSPLAYSRNEMRKQIERTQIKIQQEEAKMKPLYDQLAAFQAAYAALSGGIASSTQAPRRTVLPPTGNGRGHSGGRTSSLSIELRKEIRAHLSSGKGATEVFHLMEDQGVKYHHVQSQKLAMDRGAPLLGE